MDAPASPGDRDERMQLVAAHRRALTGHCYRMLGCPAEADDAVQETMIRAWKSIDAFEGRAALRTWLHRIATNVCLDVLADRKARMRVTEMGSPSVTREQIASFDGDLRPLTPKSYVEPIADAAAIDPDADPAERLAMRQSIRLAFVAALQHLPPKQRAALLLAEVLGWSAQEIAETLELTVPAVNSALQRARATMAERGQSCDLRTPLPPPDEALLGRYLDAFLRYDVPALTGLLREDAVMSMPPASLWFSGPAPIGDWLAGPGLACRGSRMTPVEVSGTPGFAQYRKNTEGDGYTAWALIVLDTVGDRIGTMTYFLDVAEHFPRFGLPLELPA